MSGTLQSAVSPRKCQCAIRYNLYNWTDISERYLEKALYTYNWCMHRGMTIGISISLKQIGHSAMSSPLRFVTKSSINAVELPSPDWSPSANFWMSWLIVTFPPSAVGDNDRSSSPLLMTRLGWRTARRSLAQHIQRVSIVNHATSVPHKHCQDMGIIFADQPLSIEPIKVPLGRKIYGIIDLPF